LYKGIILNIAFVTRKNESKWGGDLPALHSFYRGLKEIGQDSLIGPTVQDVLDADFIFLSNTSFNLKEEYETILRQKKRFGIIGFHADRTQYYSYCYGFMNYVGLCLAQEFPFFDLDQLLNNPQIVQYFPYTPPPLFEENYEILRQAEVCIATSHTEEAVMQRDSPGCNSKVVYLDCGIQDSFREDDSFLRWTGLKKEDYVLQVGRIELRKNQLGTILAMRDLDIPLVFIATETFYPSYERMCFEAIKKWRKAPTLVISQNHANHQDGNLRILQMPGQEKLPLPQLISAYRHAGLYCHPAFCELPGLTCLEAAKLGTSVIASQWMTLRDYFIDPIMKTASSDAISYVLPYDIQAISEQVKKQFGKKSKDLSRHPIFQRTRRDVAKDLLRALQE
jgi:glycosyltransferase involved in cell wall biosynthesis